MDFNNIKDIWKDSFSKEELLSKEQIENRLKIKKKSNDALRRVRRGYRFDIYFGGLIFLLILIVMFLSVPTSIQYFIIPFTTIFFTAIIWYTWKNYSKVRNTTIQDDQLKPNLIKTINDIEKFVTVSRSNLAKFVFIPFSLVLGMFIGLSYAAGTKNVGLDVIFSSMETGTIIKLILVPIIGTAVFVPFSLYVNKKLYKEHLDKLKKYLKEFEETEENKTIKK